MSERIDGHEYLSTLPQRQLPVRLSTGRDLHAFDSILKTIVPMMWRPSGDQLEAARLNDIRLERGQKLAKLDAGHTHPRVATRQSWNSECMLTADIRTKKRIF